MNQELQVLKDYGWSDALVAEFEKALAAARAEPPGSSHSLVVGVDAPARIAEPLQPPVAAGSTVTVLADARIEPR